MCGLVFMNQGDHSPCIERKADNMSRCSAAQKPLSLSRFSRRTVTTKRYYHVDQPANLSRKLIDRLS